MALPADLRRAADLGALRAVALARGDAVAVKPMRGAPVLRDVLREHFRGTALVFVTGQAAASLGGPEGSLPLLRAVDDGFSVEVQGRSPVILDAEALIARLDRPRPWMP